MEVTRGYFRFLAVPLAFIIALGVFAACNGDDDGVPEPPTPVPDDVTPPDNDDDAAEEFDVVMDDDFFDPDEFTVSPGRQVTFNLANEGDDVHNMRIAGEDNEFMTDDDVVSEPDLIQQGEEATLEWTAPQEPGAYSFRCDFHSVDMIGVITVQ